MELTNDIEVNASVADVWAAFTDVERIAPCLPGAQLQEIEGEEYRGIVKVKVGPITTQYKGKATFEERDQDNWKIVIKGEGRDTRGAGNASALITATLDPVADTTTKVNVSTDLTITGKVAQFGRGAIADVSTKLMGQFAENLQSLLDEPADVTPLRQVHAPEAEAVDLLEVARTPLLKRLAVPIGLVLAYLFLRRGRRR